ncbi:hypothetical protein [Brucella pituitosa]|uniref:hypothetical protein n=1 Tax=Brucella pituitosa TaxID=571256 RepID=UPI003F4AF72D
MNVAARRITGAKPVGLQQIAQDMLAKADGDMNHASEMLANYASNINSYRDELLRIGARKLLNEVPQTQRAAIFRERASSVSEPFIKAPHRMSAGAKAAQVRLRQAGAAIKSVLMELPYTIGGLTKPLRDWTGTEIHNHAEIELSKGATAVRNARFLLAVGSAAGSKKIGDAVSPADLERMKSDAESSEV